MNGIQPAVTAAFGRPCLSPAEVALAVEALDVVVALRTVLGDEFSHDRIAGMKALAERLRNANGSASPAQEKMGAPVTGAPKEPDP